MTKLPAIGIGVFFLAGVWLSVAPFAIGYQPHGHAWTAATRNDVITGAAIAAVAFTGFFTVLGATVRDLYARTTARSTARTTANADAAAAEAALEASRSREGAFPA